MKISWDYILLLVLLIKQSFSTTKDNEVYIEMLCFKNPGHLNVNGKYCDVFPNGDCDPQFEFCLGTDYDRSCHLYRHVSKWYNNMAYICGDDRDDLIDPLIVKIPGYLPKKLYLKVTVTDYNSMRSIKSKAIAEFEALFSLTPTKKSNGLKFSKVDMKRIDIWASNNPSLEIQAAAFCKPNHYGSSCHIECIPDPVHYSCDNKGNKICNPGWFDKDNNCQSRDFCKLKGCAPSARCKNNPTNRTCVCNGGQGGECYPDYDHCSSSPCMNQGTCLFNESYRNFTCACKDRYTGNLCETFVDICKDKPCKNGGKCYSNINEFMCDCTNEFTGPRCELKAEIHDSYNQSQHPLMTPVEKSVNIEKKDNSYLVGIIIGCGAISILFLLMATYCWVSHKQTNGRRLKNIPLQEINYNSHSTREAHNVLYEDVNLYEMPRSPSHYAVMRDSELSEYENPDSVTCHPAPINTSNTNIYVDETRIDSSLRTNSSCKTQPLPPVPTDEVENTPSIHLPSRESQERPTPSNTSGRTRVFVRSTLASRKN